jgi:hypothetical protein
LIFKFRFIRIKRHYWGQSHGYDIVDYFLKPYLQPKKKYHFKWTKCNVNKPDQKNKKFKNSNRHLRDHYKCNYITCKRLADRATELTKFLMLSSLQEQKKDLKWIGKWQWN